MNDDTVAVIGGSGFYHWPQLSAVESIAVESAFSANPVVVNIGRIGQRRVVFLPRHGASHNTPPHRINYLANIDALSQLSVKHVIGVNAVGAINLEMPPGSLVIPDQVVDYTWGRAHTFYDQFDAELQHVDFSDPLSSPLRNNIIDNANEIADCKTFGTYACTQGPRLETRAEIIKLKNDGCDIVGMTLMPEAVLAREKSLSYLSLCIVSNWAAGITQQENLTNAAVAPISIDEIKTVLAENLTKVQRIIVNSLTSN